MCKKHASFIRSYELVIGCDGTSILPRERVVKILNTGPGEGGLGWGERESSLLV